MPLTLLVVSELLILAGFLVSRSCSPAIGNVGVAAFLVGNVGAIAATIWLAARAL